MTSQPGLQANAIDICPISHKVDATKKWNLVD